jgi:GT2 family glycosyltransferase
MMKVSVIVATYKGDYLAETLESVRRQTHSDLEVLVLDDADDMSATPARSAPLGTIASESD